MDASISCKDSQFFNAINVHFIKLKLRYNKRETLKSTIENRLYTFHA